MKHFMTLAWLFVSSTVMASHLIGGQLSYTNVGESTYLVELVVYRDCGSNNINGTTFDDQVYVGIWEGSGSILPSDVIVTNLDNSSIVQLDPDELALYGCQVVPNTCVERASYFATIFLPPTVYGYDLIWQRCCRSPTISNIENFGGSVGIGMTVKTHIPGEADGVSNGINSTPEWHNQIPIAACLLQEFVWDCGGQDADGDSLNYILCSPLNGGDLNSAAPNPPSTPPYSEVPYLPDFGPLNPLPVQDSVNLDMNTGILSFTPSTPGYYALGICVNELRSGEVINTVIRDITLNVTICQPVCDDSGSCLNDVDGDGICDEYEVGGCTNPEACNFNDSATEDDGTCLLYDAIGVCGGDCLEVSPDSPSVCSGDEVYGCTNPEACNYFPAANVNDASCILPFAGFDCEGNSLCGVSSLSTLTVEVVEDAWEGLDSYRLYVDLPPDENLYVSAIAADQSLAFPVAPERLAVIINAPDGVFNSSLNTTWSAEGLPPAFVSVFPELAFDSYATIGLSGPASESLIPNATSPSFVGDTPTTNEFNNFYLNSGATHLEMGNGSYFILPSAFNQGFADEQGRCLIGQITTSGLLQGQLIVQILQQDGSGGVTSGGGEVVRFLFQDAGVFQGVKSEFFPTSLGGLSQIPVCGCNDPLAVNFIPWVEVGIDSCEYLCLEDADNDGVCDDVDDCVGAVDECGICNGPGANQDCGCEGIPIGDCDCEGNELDVLGVCGGSCNSDINGNGVCDDSEVLGCTYPLAENFSPQATLDDGTCNFPCEGQVNVNVFDWDGDYVVTVTDFLMMLTVYGDTDVDLDGVWDSGDDCVDTNACNYANDPSEPCAYIDILGVCGGGCEADEDNDGICDDIDTCIGIEDECGVCNGPGPTEVVIEDITILYDSVYAEQIDTWFVFEVGADTTFSYTCAPSFSVCGDPVSYQGYDYATVLIGDQCWFAENLRSENFDNGEAIPSSLSDFDWESTTNGSVAVYGDESIACIDESPEYDVCEESFSLATYGRLYNGYAVDDARGLCPSGWHVPSDGEWMIMEMTLGMSESEANAFGSDRGIDQGIQMKTSFGWLSGGNGTNTSGFSGLPGGSRDSGVYSSAGVAGIWWSSSSLNNDYKRTRFLRSDKEGVGRSASPETIGLSIRCIQDTE